MAISYLINNTLIRLFDIIFSVIGILILSPLLISVYLLIYFQNGSPLFFQERVGKNMQKFTLVKFRTMYIGTEQCATHLVEKRSTTYSGRILRKLKIDELPQLWNVILGQMSIVGPRPCLFNQKELIKQRILLNIFKSKPGITGLAQIKRIDMSDPIKLARIEQIMLKELNIFNYFLYIFLTTVGLGFGDRIKS